MINVYGRDGCLYAQMILIGVAIVGLIFSIAVKEDLKRLKFEQAQKGGTGAMLLTDPNTNFSCEPTYADDVRTS